MSIFVGRFWQYSISNNLIYLQTIYNDLITPKKFSTYESYDNCKMRKKLLDELKMHKFLKLFNITNFEINQFTFAIEST